MFKGKGQKEEQGRWRNYNYLLTEFGGISEVKYDAKQSTH